MRDLSQWFSIIGMLSVLITSIASLLWGVKTIAAKNAQIENLNSQLNNLTTANQATIKAKDSHIEMLNTQINQLATAKDETIRAKEAQIETVRLQLAEAKDFTPMKVKEFYLSTKEVLEEYIERLKSDYSDARIKINGLEQQIEEARKNPNEGSSLVQSLESERGRLNEHEIKLRQFITELEAKAGEFGFLYLLHPAHLLYIRNAPMTRLKHFLDILDKLDPDRRERCLGWVLDLIIQPRRREPISGDETMADLLIDELSYDAFKKSCYERSAVIPDFLLVNAIVNYTLQAFFHQGDETGIARFIERHRSTIRWLQTLLNEVEAGGEEKSEALANYIQVGRRINEKFEENLKDHFVRAIEMSEEAIERAPKNTKESYSLYIYFCENVVSQLLIERKYFE